MFVLTLIGVLGKFVHINDHIIILEIWFDGHFPEFLPPDVCSSVHFLNKLKRMFGRLVHSDFMYRRNISSLFLYSVMASCYFDDSNCVDRCGPIRQYCGWGILTEHNICLIHQQLNKEASKCSFLSWKVFFKT